MKLGQKSSLPCALSTVGVKSEELLSYLLCDLARDFLRYKAMKDCAQNVHVFMLWSKLDDLFAGLFKILLLLVKPVGLELLFCLLKWECSGDSHF